MTMSKYSVTNLERYSSSFVGFLKFIESRDEKIASSNTMTRLGYSCDIIFKHVSGVMLPHIESIISLGDRAKF
ncbi:hypothetical protein D3C77_508300 [compost metagenome]